MRTLAAIILMTGMILALSVAPSHSHGVNWGVSVNLGVPVYQTYAPVYPVYPTYAYYPPPVYPVYTGVVVPAHRFHGRYHRPYYHRHHWR